MWRILFLLLVVLGGLALTLALVLGIGIAKVAMVQQEDPAAVPTTAPAVAAGMVPATQQTTLASRPTDASLSAAAAATQPSPIAAKPADVAARPATKDGERPVTAAGPVPAPPAAPLPTPAPPVPPARDIVAAKPAGPGRPFVPGTIVLRGADAKVHGKLLRADPPDGDLTNWTRGDDYASWAFSPPAGRYHVDVTRATGADAGGDYAVHLNAGDRKGDPTFLAKAAPTGGWDAFRTDRVAQLDLEGGRTVLSVRRSGEPAGALMRLRRIELVPVDPPAGGAKRPAAPGVADDDNPPAVTGLTLVDARDGRPIGMLTDSMTIDLAALPPVSVRAEVAGRVGSVQFYEDGKPEHPPQTQPPFAIAGRRAADGQYAAWEPRPGRRYITVLPFAEPNAGGHPGLRHVVRFVVRSSAPVVLRAADAKLHGGEIRLEGEKGPPNVARWTDPKAYAEWLVAVPGTGRYAVEMLAARDNRDGGRFTVRAGDARLAGKLKGTGGFDAYQWVPAGVLDLARGDVRLSVRPEGSTGGRPLMSLREVRLVPVAADEEDE